MRKVTPETYGSNVKASLVLLAALEGEVTYILRDDQEGIRSLTERAFEHLNRTIAVDSGFRERWKTAYADSERQCEASEVYTFSRMEFGPSRLRDPEVRPIWCTKSLP